ncbi:MAG: hypothetical protein ACOZDY_04245, partial [Pseudomonadota bacterium]
MNFTLAWLSFSEKISLPLFFLFKTINCVVIAVHGIVHGSLLLRHGIRNARFLGKGDEMKPIRRWTAVVVASALYAGTAVAGPVILG